MPSVLFGGEAAEPGPIRNILKHGKPGSLTNVYGPAETGVIATYYEITAIPEDARTVPIGRPIANAQMYVLDSRMQPVPVGLPGEIYIGGDGVARGYWNRPELNAEKFLPDPFSTRPGALLYRTGDLARIRGNGDFEFIGRIDHQVKIRGHRIELPEVQLALAAHPDVKHAFVMVREDQSGNKRLVAYVTLQRDLPSAPDALRDYLKGKLPPYMVPTSFVVVDSIPLTTNGKVDRKALPPPHERPGVTYAPPQTKLERVVATVWEELLGIDRIGSERRLFRTGRTFAVGGSPRRTNRKIYRPQYSNRDVV